MAKGSTASKEEALVEKEITEGDIVDAFSKIKGLKRDEVEANATKCKAYLYRSGIRTKTQLHRFAESQPIFDWLRKAYVDELSRNPEFPLDPIAVSAWGGALFMLGMQDQVKTHVLGQMRASPEYIEKHSAKTAETT
ncbi:MAG: hypothetical protein JWQ71_1903 [Pedosphaera sp.]|nr:hypothetical protein [Pedosphaera sp.]